jgi:hypothetical protein
MNNATPVRQELQAPDAEALRRLSAHDFAALGMNAIAYIRSATVNGQEGFSAHAADGTPLLFAGRHLDAAHALAEHDIAVLSLH